MGNKHSKTCQCLADFRRRRPVQPEYTSHHTQTTQWLPPQETWKSTDNKGLPYGWETGVDDNGKHYYINHVEKITSREDPRDDPDYVEPPQPRQLQLTRHPQLGFGFVAGSEKPVIVRFVTEGGPSEEKLLPGDQILNINDEDVAKAPRERVIELVRSCEETITITVCQPHNDNTSRKSALLTAAKKARLKNHPSRVRFAEAVVVNGAAVISPSTHESYIPFMPNVLKVFLENGQTKSFKYDNKTTVKEVVDSLQEKLSLSAMNHFALVLQNMKSPARKLSILHEYETLSDVASKPESQHFKCLFRVAFVPKDAYDLLQSDNAAFDYFYTQCCNDVVQERFASELKYDVALRLAALQIQQHYSSSHSVTKLNLKNLERDTGLEKFVPASILDSMKPKEVRKLLTHYMKMNQSLAPGQKQLTELQAKLHYLKFLSQLKAFGGKCFVATFVEKKTEVMIVVGPRRGVAEVTNIKSYTFTTLAKFSEIEYMTLTKENDSMQQILLHIVDTAPMVEVTFSMLNDDIEEFIALVEGYYRLFVNANRTLLRSDQLRNNNSDTDVPSYNNCHNVVPTPWSYAEQNNTTKDKQPDTEGVNAEVSTAPERVSTQESTAAPEKLADFSRGPPPYNKETVDKDETVIISEKQVNVVIQKPKTLEVTPETRVTAPLASPDVSTLSGSSDSSVLPPSPDKLSEVSRSPQDSWLSTDPEHSIDSNSFDDSLSKDSDSVTGSSVSTVISASRAGSHGNGSLHSPEGSTPAAPMSRSMSAQDSRFGVSSFKTFSSPRSSPVLPRSQPTSQPAMGREVKVNHVSAMKAELDLKVKGRLQSGEDYDAESSTEPEKSPLIEGQGHSPRHKVKDELLSESDTDSQSTPISSPAKQKLLDNKPLTQQEKDRPQSFGLHSPEQLPGSEDEFKEIACSFGLHSPEAVPQEAVHPSYNPRLFSDGKLYFDPDIIDLTMLPPPVTPEEKDNLMDFSSPTMTIPPPGFNSNSPDKLESTSHAELPASIIDLPSPIRDKIDAIVNNGDDLNQQMAIIDALLMEEVRGKSKQEPEKESESDSGNETISSENIELGSSGVSDMLGLSTATGGQHESVSFDTLDIDAFIASMTVPPPPQDDVHTASRGAVGGADVPIHSPPSANSVKNKTDRINLESTPVKRIQDLPKSSPSPHALSHHTHTSTPISSSTRNTSKLDTSTSEIDTSTSVLDTSAYRLDDRLIQDLLKGTDYSKIKLDDEIAKLVTPPPPPDTSVAALTDIPMVPRVSEEKDMEYLTLYNNMVPFDSPTALEGTKLVDSLRAEYEGRNRSKESSPAPLDNPAAVSGVLHARSSSVPDDRVADHELLERHTSLDPTTITNSPASTSITHGHTSPSITHGHTSPSITHGLTSPSITHGYSSDHDGVDILSYGSPYRKALWRPAEVSKSADSSPLHQPDSLAHSRVHNSIGTLPRILRKKKPPPPPPPRRSSMQVAGDRASDSVVPTRQLHVVHQRSFSVPEETTRAIKNNTQNNTHNTNHNTTHNNHNTTHNTAHDTTHNTTAASSIVNNTHAPLAARHSTGTRNYENVFPKDSARKTYENFSVDSLPRKSKISLAEEIALKASRMSASRSQGVPQVVVAKSATLERDISGSSAVKGSTFSSTNQNLVGKSITLDRDKIHNLEQMVEASQSVDNINIQAYHEYKRSSSASSSDSSKSNSTSDSSRFQAFKSKLKSYVAPSIYKKQQVFNRGSPRDKNTLSGLDCDPHKSEYLSTSGLSSPRGSIGHASQLSGKGSSSPSSPRNSPLMPRHSSFSDHSDSQASPKTFRTFLGERTRLSSTGSESAPTSPLRTPGTRSSLPSHTTELSGLSTQQVLGSPQKVNQPTIIPSEPAVNFSTSSAEELKSQEACATIPRGKVLLIAPTGEKATRLQNDQTSDQTQSRKTTHSQPDVRNGSLSNVSAIKSELEAKFGQKASGDKISNDHVTGKQNGDQMVTLVTVAEEVLAREYSGDASFTNADNDVDHMVELLDVQLCDKSKRKFDATTTTGNLKTCKDALVSNSRTFVTDSKLLVSSATQSKEKLIHHVNSSIHTLAKIINRSAQMMALMNSDGHVDLLGVKVKDVARAYKMTVSAAREAAGRPLSDPSMKLLMKQATGLASILSSFMKTLKALDTS